MKENERGEHLLARHAIVPSDLLSFLFLRAKGSSAAIRARKDKKRRWRRRGGDGQKARKQSLGMKRKRIWVCQRVKNQPAPLSRVVDDHLAPGFFRIFSSREISLGLSVLARGEHAFPPFLSSPVRSVLPRDHVGSTPRRLPHDPLLQFTNREFFFPSVCPSSTSFTDPSVRPEAQVLAMHSGSAMAFHRSFPRRVFKKCLERLIFYQVSSRS